MSFEAPSFARGDLCRLRLKPDWHGVVINNRNWNQEYEVRGADGEAVWFQDVELEALPEGDAPDRERAPVTAGGVVVDMAEARKRRVA